MQIAQPSCRAYSVKKNARKAACLGLFFATVSTLVFSACTRQGYAYSQSPVCKQQKTRCEAYAKQRKLAGKGPEGEGMRLMREDCEASQRACAESMQTLQPSPYPSETPARNWQDALTW